MRVENLHIYKYLLDETNEQCVRLVRDKNGYLASSIMLQYFYLR